MLRRDRRRLVCHAALLAALALTLTIGSQTAASAKSKCQQWNPRHTTCLIWATIPSGPSGPGPSNPSDPSHAGVGHGSGGGSGVVSCTRAGQTVPCESTTGTWSQKYGCYLAREHPQPPPSSPAWQGHDPAKGAIYSCDIGVVGISGSEVFIPGGRAPTLNPATLAQRIAARLDIHAITIGIVPKPGANRVGLVGMPVWMWVQQPGPTSFGPITDRASAGGITVTVTAKVDQIVWDMGDGHTVTCKSAGTPYRPTYGKKDSPDCGHTYMVSSASQRGGLYAVTASSYWVVTWAGAGQAGTIRLAPMSQRVNIAVGEMQVLAQ